MPNRDPHLLDEASAWILRNGAKLRASDVEHRLIEPTRARSKDSVGLEFISSTRLVCVMLWDSGEYEVITTSATRERDPAVEVGDVSDARDVAALLDGVSASLSDEAE